eukprot:1159228-Pelagomonas_calceolata.AAC.4
MTRLLARSKLGRSILRPLLRSEIGEVANPRAWYNPEKLTPEVGLVLDDLFSLNKLAVRRL